MEIPTVVCICMVLNNTNESSCINSTILLSFSLLLHQMVLFAFFPQCTWVQYQRCRTITCISGFLEKLKDKPGVSIMADKGFTIREMLKEINVDLNLPPFLNGKQLTADEVLKGRRIASLRQFMWREQSEE